MLLTPIAQNMNKECACSASRVQNFGSQLRRQRAHRFFDDSIWRRINSKTASHLRRDKLLESGAPNISIKVVETKFLNMRVNEIKSFIAENKITCLPRSEERRVG